MSKVKRDLIKKLGDAAVAIERYQHGYLRVSRLTSAVEDIEAVINELEAVYSAEEVVKIAKEDCDHLDDLIMQFSNDG